MPLFSLFLDSDLFCILEINIKSSRYVSRFDVENMVGNRLIVDGDFTYLSEIRVCNEDE
jgi:hypothetical protein